MYHTSLGSNHTQLSAHLWTDGLQIQNDLQKSEKQSEEKKKDWFHKEMCKSLYLNWNETFRKGGWITNNAAVTFTLFTISHNVCKE